jgi:hypothetical protein
MMVSTSYVSSASSGEEFGVPRGSVEPTSWKRASHMSGSHRALAWACATTAQPRRTTGCCATTTNLVMAQDWTRALPPSVGRGRVAIPHLAVAHSSCMRHD